MSDDMKKPVVAPDGRISAQLPKWRQDFPVDLPEDQYVARRDFTKFMVLTSFAFVAGQVWIAMRNMARQRAGRPPIVKIATIAALPVGSAIRFGYPDEHDPCVLVRTGPDTFVAFDQKCTHLSCAVQPDVKAGRFHCPCHNGSFDLATGRPLAGPPRRPLSKITLEFRGGAIYASGVEARTT